MTGRQRPWGLVRRRLVTAVAVGFAALMIGALPGLAAAAPGQPGPGPAPGPAPAPAPAARTQAVEPPGSAVSRFSSCLNSAHGGDLLLLIDESSSLQSTDPAAARVTAANYLLSRLSSLGDQPGFRLDVAVAGFSDDLSPAGDWTTLNGRSAPDVTRTVGTFAGRNTGFETDYWNALEGARRSLADHARSAPGRPCQAIAWFSDGRLDISPRTSSADESRHGRSKSYDGNQPLDTQVAADRADAAARTALCSPRTGLADQLRAAGVTTFGVGLDAAGRPGDFDLMSSIATGEGSPPPTCGAPTTRRPGEFQRASDIDSLLMAFDAIVPPGPPITAERPVCAGAPCPEGRHAFVLDRSVANARILGAVDRDGVQAVLVSPSGLLVPLPAMTGTHTVTSGPTRVTWSSPSPRSVSVDLDATDRGAGWTGEWALVFVDPGGNRGARSHSSLHVATDLAPVWADRPQVLHSGDSRSAAFGVVDGTGRPLDPATIAGDATLSAVLSVPGRPDVPVATAPDKTRIAVTSGTLDLRDAPVGPATLRLTLGVRTAPATRPDGTVVPGTPLIPRAVDVPLTVAPPAGYPETGSQVDFGTTPSGGGTELTADLPVTGPGCVWVAAQPDPALDASPADAGRVTVAGSAATSPASCVTLAPGQRGSVPLRMTSERVGNGTVSGRMAVMLAPPGEPAAARPAAVSFRADLRKPLQPVNFVAAGLAALLLGIGIPIGLLYLSRWLTARIPHGPLEVARVDVDVHDGRVYRGPDMATPFDLVEGDLAAMVTVDRHNDRDLGVAGLRVRTRAGGSPFRPAHALAGPGPGLGSAAWLGRMRACGSRSPFHRRFEAVLPLSLRRAWVVLHDPDGPPDRAVVVVLVRADGSNPGPARAELAAEIADLLPVVLDRMRDTGRPATPTRPASPQAPTPGPSSWHPFGGSGPMVGGSRPFAGAGGNGSGNGSGNETGGGSASDGDPFSFGNGTGHGDIDHGARGGTSSAPARNPGDQT